MGDGLGQVPVIALLAVVAVAPRRVVATVEADPSALPPRQLVQLHVEATAAGVQVAVTGCLRKRERERERGGVSRGRKGNNRDTQDHYNQFRFFTFLESIVSLSKLSASLACLPGTRHLIKQ